MATETKQPEAVQFYGLDGRADIIIPGDQVEGFEKKIADKYGEGKGFTRDKAVAESNKEAKRKRDAAKAEADAERWDKMRAGNVPVEGTSLNDKGHVATGTAKAGEHKPAVKPE